MSQTIIENNEPKQSYHEQNYNVTIDQGIPNLLDSDMKAP